jgi:hypothetical protein
VCVRECVVRHDKGKGQIVYLFFAVTQKNYCCGYNLVVKKVKKMYLKNKSHCCNKEQDCCEGRVGTFS